MSSTATITSKTGPAITVTSLALTDVRSFNFQVSPTSVLKVTFTDGRVTDFDIAATATVTATISSGVMAVTVSQ